MKPETTFDFIIKAKFWLYLAIFFLPLERVLIIKISQTNIRFTHIFLFVAFFVWVWQKILEMQIKRKKSKGEFSEFSKRFPQISRLYKLIFVYFAILGFGLLAIRDFNRKFSVWLYTVFVLSSIYFIPHFFHKVKEIAIKEIRLAIKIFLWSSLATCVFGIYQFAADMLGAGVNWTFLTEKYTRDILGFTRIQGFFVEPLYFANFLIFPIVFCILLLMNKVKNPKTKIFLWLTLALSIINFILTNARGAFITLFVIFILFLILNRKRFSKEFLVSCAAAIVILILFFGTVSFVMPESSLGSFVKHATHPLQGAAFEERSETFGFAWQMFKDRPIVGHGPGSFGLMAPLKEWEVRENWKIANNLYLEFLAESGILGFTVMMIFFILLLISLYKSFAKTDNKLLKILFQGFFLVILGILIQYNTFSVIYLPYVWIVIGLAVGTLKFRTESK